MEQGYQAKKDREKYQQVFHQALQAAQIFEQIHQIILQLRAK